MVVLYIPVENKTPNKIPKALIDTASSKLEAAINSVLIPFTSPYPKRLSRNRLGTNTAGLTADKVNLKIDKLIFKCEKKNRKNIFAIIIINRV